MSKKENKKVRKPIQVPPFHHKGELDIRLMSVAISDIRDCFSMLPGNEVITRDHLLEIVEQRIDFLKLMITKSRGEETT